MFPTENDYNHFVNSGTKKFGVLRNHQINEFSHTFQVVYWKCSKYVPKKFWWSYLIPFLKFLIFFKKFIFHFLTIGRPFKFSSAGRWRLWKFEKSVLHGLVYYSKKICLVKAFDFIIVYAFQNPTSYSHMIILLN